MTEVFNAPVIPEPMPGQSAEDYLKWTLLPVLRQSLGRLQSIAEQRDPPVPDAYTITNLTDTRTFDCNGTSLATAQDVLGTLLKDLQAKGLLKGTAS